MPQTILLDGRRLTRRDFYAVVLGNHRVGLAPRARVAMRESRALVEKIIAEKQVVYGVTTGVEAFPPSTLIPPQRGNCN